MNAHAGWLCPRCETVHAPFVAKCTCTPELAKPVGSQLENLPPKKPDPFARQPRPGTSR